MEENQTIEFMINIYCKKKHKTQKMCHECEEVYNYCVERNEKCPRKDVKTFCASCPIHCYKKDMRQKVREIMKFSGPRMIFYKPKYAIAHVRDTLKHKRETRKKMKKIIYITVGMIGVALGFIGAILPLIPAFPFLLLAAYCFGKSSEKLDTWFKSTKLYKDNLEDFVAGQGMTKKAKIRVLSLISGLMLIGFICMGNVPVGRIVLVFVWIFHIIYFVKFVKTKSEN